MTESKLVSQNIRMLAFLFLAFLLVPAVTQGADGSASLQVSVSKYEPYPASPGNYVDVWLKVENTGYSSAKNATLIIDESYPFIKLEGYDYVWSIGELQTSEATVKKFRFLVDRGAVSGTNYLKVKYSSDPSTGIWVTKELGIEVKEYQVVLRISSVEFEGAVAPGNPVNLTLTLENDAGVFLKNILISISRSSDDLFKYAVEGTNTRIIEKLAPEEKREVTFVLLIDASSKTGVYSLPLTLEYYDESNNLYSRTENIGIAVNQKPELEVYIDSSEGYFVRGALNKVRISVVNTGTTDAKFVSVSVKDADGYKLLGTTSKYLGEIESDDQASITVEMYIGKDAPSLLQIPVMINYKDSLNNQYSDEFKKEVRTFGKDELKQYGAYTSKTGIYLYIVLILVIGYIVRKRKTILSWLASKK